VTVPRRAGTTETIGRPSFRFGTTIIARRLADAPSLVDWLLQGVWPSQSLPLSIGGGEVLAFRDLLDLQNPCQSA